MTKAKTLAVLGAAVLLGSTPAAFAQTTPDPAATATTGMPMDGNDNDDSGKWGLLGLLGLAGLLGLKRRDHDADRNTRAGTTNRS